MSECKQCACYSESCGCQREVLHLDCHVADEWEEADAYMARRRRMRELILPLARSAERMIEVFVTFFIVLGGIALLYRLIFGAA